MFEKALKTLRLHRGAGMEEVREAYTRLTRRYPPEHFPEKFKEIKRAYEQLSLQWSALEPLTKEIALSETPAQLVQNIMQESLQMAKEKQDQEDTDAMDAWELEPILHSTGYKSELRTLLEEIKEEGLEYADPDRYIP